MNAFNQLVSKINSEKTTDAEQLDNDSINSEDYTDDYEAPEEDTTTYEDVAYEDTEWNSEVDNTLEIEETETIEPNENLTVETPVVEEPVVKQSETSPNTSVGSSNLNLDSPYLLVVGSFGSKANANRLQKKLTSGYPNATVKYINGLNRVIISTYNSEEEAERQKSNYISATGGSAFVLAQ